MITEIQTICHLSKTLLILQLMEPTVGIPGRLGQALADSGRPWPTRAGRLGQANRRLSFNLDLQFFTTF